MNVCPDPKASCDRNPGNDSYYLFFDVFYKNPYSVCRVSIQMPCLSTARALCNFLNDRADKTPRDAEGNPHPLLTNIAEHGPKLGKVLDEICERLSKVEIKQEYGRVAINSKDIHERLSRLEAEKFCRTKLFSDDYKAILDDLVKRVIALEESLENRRATNEMTAESQAAINRKFREDVERLDRS